MLNRASLKNYYWLWLAVMVMVLDQLTKYLANSSLIFHVPQKVFSFINLTLAYNRGAAFSFLDSASGWQNGFFIILATIVSLFLLCWLYQLATSKVLDAVGICLILGGAWANVIDRAWHGYVIDFLDFHIGDYHWPIFNLADTAICIGSLLMIISACLHNRNKV